MNAPIYLLAATGGLEAPSFKSFLDLDEARKTFRNWESDFLLYPGDRVDLMKIEGIVITLISSAENDSDYDTED